MAGNLLFYHQVCVADKNAIRVKRSFYDLLAVSSSSTTYIYLQCYCFGKYNVFRDENATISVDISRRTFFANYGCGGFIGVVLIISPGAVVFDFRLYELGLFLRCRV